MNGNENQSIVMMLMMIPIGIIEILILLLLCPSYLPLRMIRIRIITMIVKVFYENIINTHNNSDGDIYYN